MSAYNTAKTIELQAPRFLRRPVPVARLSVDVGDDGKWGYNVVGSDGRTCAISTRRYETLRELADDLEADFPHLHVRFPHLRVQP